MDGPLHPSRVKFQILPHKKFVPTQTLFLCNTNSLTNSYVKVVDFPYYLCYSVTMETSLSSQLAIDSLIRNNGDAHLAAELLHVTKQELIAAITQDQLANETLQRQLRTLTLLGAYELFDQTKLVYLATLVDMPPKELAKTLTTLIGLLTALTTSTTTNANINITEVVLRMLPPEARQALEVLSLPPQNIINGNGRHE